LNWQSAKKIALNGCLANESVHENKSVQKKSREQREKAVPVPGHSNTQIF